METVGQFAKFMSSQLNDQRLDKPYARWDRAAILNYFNSAWAFIGGHKPEIMTREVELTLVPGARQAHDGVRLIGLRSGKRNRPAGVASENLYAAFGTFAPAVNYLKPNEAYEVRTVSVDTQDPKTFYVSPAVPAGQAPVVKADLETNIEPLTGQDWNKKLPIPSKYYDAFMNVAFAYAYGLDSDSPVSMQQVDSHMRKAAASLGFKYTSASRFSSGYYEGQTGTGDPRAAR